MMNRSGIITLCVIGLLLVVGGYYTFQINQKAATKPALSAPAMVALTTNDEQSPYTDLAGNPVVLSNYVGSVLVVNVWASWSPFSKNDLAVLSRLADRYAADPVHFLAINRAENPLTAERFLKVVNATSDLLLVLDPDDRYYKSIGGYSMPETVLYDSEGEEVLHLHGALTEEVLTEHLDEILQQP
jgi:thiol-disulfide isomerase/thioredoxin